MNDEAKNAKAASVKARLMNLSRENGWPFELLVQRYAIERLLHRLAGSQYVDLFVLKGAMVLL